MDKFKIFVVVAIVVLTLAIGGGVFLVFTMLNSDTTENGAPPVPVEYRPDKMETHSLDEIMMSNLVSFDGKTHVIRIGIAFGVDLSSKEYSDFMDAFENRQVIFKSKILEHLRQQEYEMLLLPDAKEKLAIEIKDIIHEEFRWVQNPIYQVYFSEFLVQ
ncbi:MAG: hypothetical protein ATN36_00245 [Epulopiscium sp. Nele67-Bin005]|nr:MAG: hypothetical protein ATN36_00245 [Epulopiscium sp. Nele67-Bin005]